MQSSAQVFFREITEIQAYLPGMRTPTFLAAAVAACGWFPVSATIVGTGLVHQPVYLGNGSQPDRIPLSPAICNSNHGYGSHSVIFETRPCFHGHFITDNRPEYEQNLAVLFGISCELSDSTQMPGTTATFTIRRAQPPKNAPYTQERVFAATLQTLLLHSRGMTKNHPLTVEIKAVDMPQPKWAAGFAGPYFYSDDDLEKQSKGEVPLKPLPVPGIRIDETSVPGVTYLIVEGVAPNPKITPQFPVFVPFTHEGESDSIPVKLVPMWPGDSWSEPLGVLTRPDLPYYEKWGSNHVAGSFKESGPTGHQSHPNPILESCNIVVADDEKSCSVRVVGGEMTPEQFSAFVFACVATVRPTEKHPLKLGFAGVALNEGYRILLANDPAWKDGGTSCEFVLEPTTMKLLKGSVPWYGMTLARGEINVSVLEDREKMHFEEDPAPPWISAALVKISRDLPAVSRKEVEELTRGYRGKLLEPASGGTEDADGNLRILLALSLYQKSDPLFFEQLWWRDSARVTRAVAGYCAMRSTDQDGALVSPKLERELQVLRFDHREQEMRRQELSNAIQSRLKNAIEDWEKRCADLNAKDSPSSQLPETPTP
jgi:hypothetical protein